MVEDGRASWAESGTVENNGCGGSNGEDFTQWSETGEVEVKMMIDGKERVEESCVREQRLVA